MNLDALFSMNCGMYVLCSGDAGRYNGLIINAVVQVTAFPNQVIASVNKESLTCTLVQKSGHFTLSVLDKEAPLQLIGLFGFRTGKNFDKMTQVQYFLGKNGMPVINEHTVAYLEAKVISQLDAGTHILLLGEITECDYLNKAEPMTYGYYRDVKGGKVPRTAATYHEESSKTMELERYRCSVCGYIYDSRFGDPDSGIASGTRFADLPETWTCPVCGATREKFQRL